MSWALVFAVLITAAVLGRISDAVFHRYYNEPLKDWLYTNAIRFDEFTYGQLAHNDVQKVLDLFNILFGKKFFSLKASILYILIIIPGYLLSGIYSDWATSVAGVSKDLASLAYTWVLVGFSFLIVLLSIWATRIILARIKPRMTSLATWVSVDILIAVVLLPIPLGATTFLYVYGTLLYEYPWAFYKSWLGAFHEATNTVEVVLINPFRENSYDVWDLLFVAIFSLVALPTIFHMILVSRDLLYKAVVKPSLEFFSRLFEFLSGYQYPITWLFGILGTVPAVIQAWLEVFADK